MTEPEFIPAAHQSYWLARRVDPQTGWEISAVRMLAGNVRLCVGEPGSDVYDRGWCFRAPARQDALDAVEHWDGRGEAPGRWYKSLQTGQTRQQYLWP